MGRNIRKMHNVQIKTRKNSTRSGDPCEIRITIKNICFFTFDQRIEPNVGQKRCHLQENTAQYSITLPLGHFSQQYFIMQAINPKKTLPPNKSNSIDFGLLLTHPTNKDPSPPRSTSKTAEKRPQALVEIAAKKMETIEDIQEAEKQFRYDVKAMEDREHAKRFAKLESIKKFKTEGNEREPSKVKKRILVIPIQQKAQVSSYTEIIPHIHGKKIRSHSQNSRGSVKMVERQIDFYDMNEEIEDLSDRLNTLIARKLSKLSGFLKYTKDADRIVFDKPLNKSDFYNDLKDLIRRIKQLKSSNKDNDEEIKLLNKKIECIESLIAENVTESELIKKYYLCFNFNRSRDTIGRFMSMGPRVFKTHHERSPKREHQKYFAIDNSLKKGVFFGQSTNKQSFRPPKKEFYNHEKYKQKAYAFNDQPLPRSSYKRQFLNVPILPFQKMKANEEDSHQLPKYTTTMKSRYKLDFHQPRVTQNVDYKELDSYQNKLKFLEVSYFPTREQLLEKSFTKLQKDDSIIDNEMIKECLSKQPSRSIQEAIYDKMRFVTESQKSYGAFFGNQKSRIKHQQLKEFQYRMKNLYKS